MREVTGMVMAAQQRAKFYADRNPSAARRIMGLGPVRLDEYVKAPAMRPATPPRLPYQVQTPYWTSSPRRQALRQRTMPDGVQPSLDTTPAAIVQAVCNLTRLSPGAITGKSRYKSIARPRQIATWLVFKHCPDLSLKQIGYIFNLHHTTVLHAIRTVPERIANGDKETIGLVQEIEADLGQPKALGE